MFNSGWKNTDDKLTPFEQATWDMLGVGLYASFWIIKNSWWMAILFTIVLMSLAG
ncbi:hypothetical protein AGMMS49959_01040 [Planctomycetales bacterium]|nr:hypothetical protein AGMMS49959_01040 [Planctomycetales bacterium]